MHPTSSRTRGYNSTTAYNRLPEGSSPRRSDTEQPTPSSSREKTTSVPITTGYTRLNPEVSSSDTEHPNPSSPRARTTYKKVIKTLQNMLQIPDKSFWRKIGAGNTPRQDLLDEISKTNDQKLLEEILEELKKINTTLDDEQTRKINSLKEATMSKLQSVKEVTMHNLTCKRINDKNEQTIKAANEYYESLTQQKKSQEAIAKNLPLTKQAIRNSLGDLNRDIRNRRHITYDIPDTDIYNKELYIMVQNYYAKKIQKGGTKVNSDSMFLTYIIFKKLIDFVDKYESQQQHYEKKTAQSKRKDLLKLIYKSIHKQLPESQKMQPSISHNGRNEEPTERAFNLVDLLTISQLADMKESISFEALYIIHTTADGAPDKFITTTNIKRETFKKKMKEYTELIEEIKDDLKEAKMEHLLENFRHKSHPAIERIHKLELSEWRFIDRNAPQNPEKLFPSENLK